jgi:putative ubiquitin-RnfH superfamily antitoxin RatB of RatAB toxin-antitoxin module
MKKTVAKTIAVAVVRLGSDPLPLTMPVGSTVEEAIEKAGIDLPDNAQLFVAGVPADLDSELENKDSISIVTPKQAGI